MIDTKNAPYAALLLRLSMGVMFIAHALLKPIVFTMPGTVQYFESLGLPGWWGWVVMIYELGGGILLILGVYARWIAALLGIHLIVVAVLAHRDNGWVFANQGGGWEFPVFWGLACFALALLGDGAHALRPSTGARASA